MYPPSQVSREFGKAVRKLRLERGITQQQLADACGLDLSYIGQIERGQRNPTLGVIHGIAKVLDTKISELLKKANL
jgi:transcriptional regulator with XRE-family HTH domain